MIKAIDALTEIFDEIVEDAKLHPEENGNTEAQINKIKREVNMLPDRCKNLELDDDEDDDDTGVDADDVQDKAKADESDASSAKAGLKGKVPASK